jgi:pyridoxamine 5'-phosphate oxidase
MADAPVFSPDEATDPIALFHRWLQDAEKKELNDPNAAALATADADGAPSVRMVLVKKVDAAGFRFFTNAESQKGRELAGNPRAALCFHWKSLRRQVRVAGPVVPVANAETDAYFHSRSRRSQVGAAVSQQSRPLPDRAEMESAVEQFAGAHPGEIPRPDYWRGFSIQPERIEFWSDGPDRLHDRVLCTRNGNGWQCTRLWP